jgi:hypothetical protein
MRKIVDTQMNLGKNVFGPSSDVEIYIKNASKYGVFKTILIPTGTHELILPNGDIEKSCIWLSDGEKIIYRRYIINKEGDVLQEDAPRNPYSYMNQFCYSKVKDLNKEQSKIKFYFAPKVHPKLDEKEEIEKYLSLDEVVAIKIQGLASYTIPTEVPPYLISLCKSYDLPLMVHTDFRRSSKEDAMSKLIQQNTATKWAKWAMENNVRTYLAHGLRLEPEATKIVNSTENLFMVGLGPDKLLNNEKDNLAIPVNDYLTYLFDTVSHDKICFNYDYPWNVKNRGEWNQLDWDTSKRIIKYAKRRNLDESFLEMVFKKNAEEFFELR